MNGALKAFGFCGRSYIIEAGKLTGFERFVRNMRFICNLFFLFKGIWVNWRSHKLWRLLRLGVTWFAPRKSDVEIGLTILSRLIANYICYLSFVFWLTFMFRFFGAIYILKFDNSVSLSFRNKFPLFSTIQHSFNVLWIMTSFAQEKNSHQGCVKWSIGLSK